jgi:hypothetical protein
VTGHQMPRPESEREAWEEELKELTALLATHQRELKPRPKRNTERREGICNG